MALCPTAVPQLLEALEPQHMQQLSTTLLQLTQQQPQQQLHMHHAGAEDCVEATSAAMGQQLRHLGVVDVLLLISLAAQQQWAADVSLVLMHGVLEAGRWVSWCMWMGTAWQVATGLLLWQFG